MQSKSLPQTLLINSQITGVRLNSLDTNLSDLGHGLYIESISKDRYIDLRMCCDKPFWGHSHPLMVQYQFKNFSPSNINPDYGVLSKLELNHFVTSYQTYSVKQLSSDIKHEKIHLVLDESSDIGLSTIDLIDHLSQNNQIIIEERDLILHCSENLFITHHVNCPKILSLSFFEYSLINEPLNQKSLHEQEICFYNAFMQYVNFILLHSDGKLKQDQIVTDKFLSLTNHGIPRIDNYLLIPKNDLNEECFLNKGLLINESNFIGDTVKLAIPVSCTNSELLDTLERISSLLKR